METLMICLLIVALLPLVSKIPLAYAMHRSGGYDNNYPRKQERELTGFGARAYGAHQNSHEALLLFAVAVLMAVTTGHLSAAIQKLGIVFVVARILYHGCYLFNWASLRSLMFVIAWVSAVSMMVLSL